MKDGKKPETTRAIAEAAAPPSDAVLCESEEIVSIPTDLIDPNPYQQRTEFAKEPLAELAQSIRDSGQLQPAIVRAVMVNGSTRYQLIAGERRWRACQLVGLPLRAVIREVGIEDAEVFALIENIDREDLCFWDLMNGVVKMKERLGNCDAVATAIHRKKRYVEKVIRAHVDINSANEIAEVFADQRKTLDYTTACRFSEIAEELRKLIRSDNRQYRRYIQKMAKEGIKRGLDAIHAKLKQGGRNGKSAPVFSVQPVLKESERQLTLQVSLSKLVPPGHEKIAEIRGLFAEFLQKAEALTVEAHD